MYYTGLLGADLYRDGIMTKQKLLRDNASHYRDEKKEGTTLQSFQHGLLISAWLLLFFVIPLLFIWSSLGRIHVHPFGPSLTPATGEFSTKTDQLREVNLLQERTIYHP